MKKFRLVLLNLMFILFGFTAPLMVIFALLFTKRDAKVLAWSWYDTPDEDDFIGLYEPDVKENFDKYGWFYAAWDWFGVRNRGHGFVSLWSKEAPGHWPEGPGEFENGEFFYNRTYYPVFNKFMLHITFGWAVYASRKYDSKFEYRPKMAVKTRSMPTPPPAEVAQ